MSQGGSDETGRLIAWMGISSIRVSWRYAGGVRTQAVGSINSSINEKVINLWDGAPCHGVSVVWWDLNLKCIV